MADIKDIKIGDTTYSIKDAPARERLDSVESDVSALETEMPLKATKLEIAGFKNITVSNVAPTDAQGSNGDVWLVYE